MAFSNLTLYFFIWPWGSECEKLNSRDKVCTIHLLCRKRLLDCQPEIKAKPLYCVCNSNILCILTLYIIMWYAAHERLNGTHIFKI